MFYFELYGPLDYTIQNCNYICTRLVVLHTSLHDSEKFEGTSYGGVYECIRFGSKCTDNLLPPSRLTFCETFRDLKIFPTFILKLELCPYGQLLKASFAHLYVRIVSLSCPIIAIKINTTHKPACDTKRVSNYF